MCIHVEVWKELRSTSDTDGFVCHLSAGVEVFTSIPYSFNLTGKLDKHRFDEFKELIKTHES